jgi:hypothetical protein
VTRTNSGAAPLTITGVAATGDFAQTNTCGSSLAEGANCTISITFTPTATGVRNGTLTVTDNSNAVGGSQQTATLTGNGAVPLASVSTASVTFPSLLAGSTSAAQTVMLSNAGLVPLTIASISLGGTIPVISSRLTPAVPP